VRSTASPTADGQWARLCGADCGRRLAAPSPGADSIRLLGHNRPVSMVAFRKDNQHSSPAGRPARQALEKSKATPQGSGRPSVATRTGSRRRPFKDGYHVVSSSVDRRLKIWRSPARAAAVAEHTGAVERVAVIGRHADRRPPARRPHHQALGTARPGSDIATLTGHTAYGVIFTPDSKQLVSSGYDSVVRLWQVSPRARLCARRSRKVLGPFRHHSSYIASIRTKTLFVWLPIDGAAVKTISQ